MSDKVKDIVSWVMPDEKILKLEKSSKTLDISDAVFKFMDSKKLLDKEDFEVEVDIDEGGDNDGVIVKLVVNGEKSKKEEKSEKKTEKKEEKEVKGCKKVLTVAGVAVNNKGVIFEEEENNWYTLDDSIDAEKFKKECTKKEVEVDIERSEKGNDIVKSYKVVDVDDTGVSTIDVNDKNISSAYVEKQRSIEAQGSFEHAQTLAGILVQQGILKDVKSVNEFVTKRAEENFKAIQEFKNS